MIKTTERFFCAEEKERIEETIRKVESGTIGEVAVMIVESSDSYPEAEVAGGVLLGSLFSLVVSALFLHTSVWSFIPLSLIFFFPSRLIVRKVPVLKDVFLGARRKHLAVKERAVRAFFEKGLYRTKQNAGVLFFLSLFERKVWVLADRGIHEKIGQETLNRLAEKVSLGIREGRACNSLCSALEEAGGLLARYFPVTKGDTNELANDIMTE